MRLGACSCSLGDDPRLRAHALTCPANGEAMTLSRRLAVEAALAYHRRQVHALEGLLEPEPGDLIDVLAPAAGGWLRVRFVQWVGDGAGLEARDADGRTWTCGRTSYRLPPLPEGMEPPQ